MPAAATDAPATSTRRGQPQAAVSLAKGRATLARVHDAARSAHAEGRRPTLRVLAAEAGISPPACYRHSLVLKAEGRWPLADPDPDPADPEAARVLATDPASIAIAMRAARKAARLRPRIADEYESAAWVALWQLALSYRPCKGDFPKYLAIQMRRAMLDVSRLWNGAGTRKVAPTVESLDIALSAGPDAVGEAIAAGEMPVGWEMESEEAFEQLLAPLDDRNRQVMRWIYLECNRGKADLARRLRCSDDLLFLRHRRSLDLLRWCSRRGGDAA